MARELTLAEATYKNEQRLQYNKRKRDEYDKNRKGHLEKKRKQYRVQRDIEDGRSSLAREKYTDPNASTATIRMSCVTCPGFDEDKIWCKRGNGKISFPLVYGCSSHPVKYA